MVVEAAAARSERRAAARQQLLPVLFGDSRYTDRQPTGDMEIVRTVSAENVRRYYETWYRPDLMADCRATST
ncbi:MAG: hypothetical protein R2838_04805 [Caldilineaceae bacterium]